MLKDILPFDRAWSRIHASSPSLGAITSFIHFLERRLGGEFVYDQARIGYESLDMVGLLELAEELRAMGVIRSYKRNPGLPDEPRMALWHAEYATLDGYNKSGGNSLDNHPLALTKALAEAIERHAWFTYDKFSPLQSATVADMEKEPDFLDPRRFASYSESQRKKSSHLQIQPNTSFLWTKSYSWTKERPIWVPAQMVSGHKKKSLSICAKEPLIRAPITTGIATYPSRIQALLSGALEVIERDAFIITWLNQLSPSKIDLEELSLRSKSLAQLLTHCRKYRLEPHAIRLPTDAPTYAICVMLEDTTGTLPRFSVGISANRNPAQATEKAILEALRAHLGTRNQMLSPGDWDPKTKATELTKHNRLMYWTEGTRGDRLAFLIKGNTLPPKKEKWETDTDEEHFARIVAWCREKGYELISKSFTDIPANLPGWHIEFVSIPELQPMYLDEKLPCLGGKRLRDIPKQFGYTSREPNVDNPHPFA